MSESIWDKLVFCRNAVIEASAGTGKTFTLEKIVKRLVTEEKYDIRNILLVTFTEKAAGELKERIRKALEGNDASKDLADATICTIHAFCREVLADYPFESGMMMEMGDVGKDDALYQQAVHNVLTSQKFKDAYQKEFATLMEYWNADGDIDKFAMDAAAKLKDAIGKENFLEEWKKELDLLEKKDCEEKLEEKVNDLPCEKDNEPGAFAIAHTANGTTFRNRSDWNKKQLSFFSALDDQLRVLKKATTSPRDYICALDFLATGPLDFKLYKWDGVIIDKPFCEYKCEYKDFEVYAKVQELAAAKARVLREKKLCEIVEMAYPVFVRLKLRSNSVTYDDLIRYTAQLVTAATAENADDAKMAFVERMRERYRIALVDEFQDTDAKQWEIFKKLFAEVGHLIVVGDPKQAIYGWRGADLATYFTATNELKDNELKDKGGQFESLDYMYRSTEEMVKAFNIIFNSGWFPVKEEESSIDYKEVRFPPEKVKTFDYPDGEQAVELLEAGSGLEAFLENAANEMIRLHQDIAWKPQMDWNDMCVLVRINADGVKAKDILEGKGIPCRIFKETGAFDDVEAESILALFDYLSRPRSLGTLSALLLTPLWDVKPEELEERLNKGEAGFDRLCTKWRTYALKRDWNKLFESVIRNTKNREKTSGYRQIFDTLLTNYGHAQSLSELATVLRQLKSGDEDAGEHGTYRNRASEESAVQIMTIHAAKGLEANAVFVAAGFSGNATSAEEKRLFYVALTRAVFKLYLPWSSLWSKDIPKDSPVKDRSALKTYLGKAIKALPEYEKRMRHQDKLELSSKEDCGMKGWRFKWDSFSSLGHSKDPISTVFPEVMKRLCENDGTGDSIGFEIGKIDFKELIDEKDGKNLLDIVRQELEANGVKDAKEEKIANPLARMVWNALRTELDFGDDKFRLCDIALEDRKPNGDIDLPIRRNDGYYIINLKTNSLDDYDDKTVEQAIESAGYDRQYNINTLDAEKRLGAKVKGIAYLFVRGGECEGDKPSGKFIHAMTDKERDDFQKAGGEDNDNQPPKSLVPKGTASGMVFHEVMERLCENDGKDDSFEIGKNDDFNKLIDEKDGKKSPLLEIVRRRLAANGVPNRVGKNAEEESTAISLARMAWNALRTELDFNGDKFKLCDIGPNDRKAEVNFVIDETISLGIKDKDREGALNGDIDLLIQRNGKYYIIDWKTNSLDDYKAETVEQAMDDAGYHWQYKIYTLAAEKWLGAKVNGIAYLFVRGGEFEDNKPSGKFVRMMTDKEREDFKKALENRLKANDEDEERKEQEEQ